MISDDEATAKLAELTAPDADLASASPAVLRAMVHFNRRLCEVVTEERDKAVAQQAELLRKAGEGTLHALYCSVAPSNPVGAPGCSCPTGRELKKLRVDLAVATDDLRQAEKEVMRQKEMRGDASLRAVIEGQGVTIRNLDIENAELKDKLLKGG